MQVKPGCKRCRFEFKKNVFICHIPEGSLQCCKCDNDHNVCSLLPEEMRAAAKAAAKSKAPKASSSKQTREEEISEDKSDLEILEVFPAKKKKMSGESPIFSYLFQLKLLSF